MAINYIYPFGQNASGTNILTDAAYQSDGERTIGNQPGIARQELVNKALRNDSALAAGLAQFIADYQSSDVHDSLTPNELSTYIHEAVSATIQNHIRMPLVLGLNKTTTGPSIPSGAITPISWDSSIANRLNMWSSGTPTDLVIPQGVSTVRIHSSIGWNWSTGGSAGELLMNFVINGAFVEAASGLELYQAATATNPTLSQHSMDVSVTPGDVVHIIVSQTTGSPVNLQNENFQCNAAIEVIE